MRYVTGAFWTKSKEIGVEHTLYLMRKESWIGCLQSLGLGIGTCDKSFVLSEEESCIAGEDHNLTGFATEFAFMIMFMALCRVATLIRRFNQTGFGLHIDGSSSSLLPS